MGRKEIIRQKAKIMEKFRLNPKEVTADDIKTYGNDIAELYIKVSSDKELLAIPYLSLKGHKFGYDSVDDPVNKDPNNILNLLIAATPNAPDVQLALSQQLYTVLLYHPIPWQIIIRLAFAYYDGELPYINGVFDIDRLWIMLDMLLYKIKSPTDNYMYLFRELLREFKFPLDSAIPFTNDKIIHEAIKLGNHEAVKLLIEAGADPNIRGQDGKTACELAADVEMQNIVCPPILGADAAPVRQHLGVERVEALAGRQRLSRRLKALTLFPGAAAGAGGQDQSGYIGGRRKTKRRRSKHRK